MNTKNLLIVAIIMLVPVGLLWLIAPGVLFGLLGVATSPALEYMGRRYSAYIIGLVVTLWMARSATGSDARRAVLMGTFVAVALTCATSLYGALSQLAPGGWFPFAGELPLTLGFAYFLFIKPEKSG